MTRMSDILLSVLVSAVIVILMQFTINEYLYGYSQTQYCHVHYANGTVVCHKMPMNMTMPINMTIPVSAK
jgi:hypothetical protein